MQKRSSLALAVFSALYASAYAAPVVFDMRSAAEPKIRQLIVQPARFDLAHAQSVDKASLASFSQAAGIELSHARAMSGQAQVLRLPYAMSASEAEIYAARLVASGLASYAEPDRWVRPSLEPNDPFYVSRQWHYKAIKSGFAYGDNNYGLNLPGAWDVTQGLSAVTVAVLDSGLLAHADIDSNIMDDSGQVKPGYDFISVLVTDPDSGVVYPPNDGDGRDPDPTDPGDWYAADDPVCGGGEEHPSTWHGTHVTGTVGALSNNGVGVSGVAWNVSLLPVRVLGKCGGVNSDIIDGMRWAVGMSVPGVPANAHPARVLSMSLGGEGACDKAYQAAISDVRKQGAVVVVAAGNESMDASKASPANCSGVISVAATDQQGQRAYYSNYGASVSIAAPGGDSLVDTQVYSTADGGAKAALNDNAYESKQGTSMATPHVSGVIALMLARNATLTPDQVLQKLKDTATAFPDYPGTSKDAFFKSRAPSYCLDASCSFDCTTSLCGAGIVNATAVIDALSNSTPDPFSFAAQSNVALSTLVTSNSITVSGINVPASISVSNGEYSLDCAPSGFTSSAGKVSVGQTVCVRHLSSVEPETRTDTTLTIGGVSGVFSSTTLPADRTPDAFSFSPVSDAAPDVPVTSAPVTIQGINTATPISVVNGEYSIGCGASFTAKAGEIRPSQTVCLRHTSSSASGGSASSTLTVGGVSASFVSTTRVESGGGGSMGLFGLLALLALSAARQRRWLIARISMQKTKPESAPN
ncbi:MAG: S8 family peptidase [Pseudomonadota bacterium]